MPLDTVAGCLESALTPLLDGRRPRLACAGRTDAGVSALNQLVSFSCFPELSEQVLREAVDAAAPEAGTLRLLSAQRVPRSWHATFSTRWRRYVYLLPCDGLGVTSEAVHRQIAPLVGAPRDYGALGRGLPKGKDTHCTLLRARATHACLPRWATGASARRGTHPRARGLGGGGAGDDATGAAAIRIELVADRFLRRMVRTLVASAVWAAQQQPHTPCEGDEVGDEAEDDEAAAGGGSLLLRVATSGAQEYTAHPAPAQGLVFAGAGGEGDAWA